MNSNTLKKVIAIDPSRHNIEQICKNFGVRPIPDSNIKVPYAPIEIDIDNIGFAHLCKPDEFIISHFLRRSRLSERNDLIPLDASVGLAILDYQKEGKDIPKLWNQELNYNRRRIFFDNSLFINSQSQSCIIFMYQTDSGIYTLDLCNLDEKPSRVCFSAIINLN